MRNTLMALTLLWIFGTSAAQGATSSSSCEALVPGVNSEVKDLISPCAISVAQGLASAEADVGYGVLRGEAQVSFVAGGNTYARAQAWFTDEITVSGGPGLAGQLGTMTVEFYVQGFLDATGSGRSSLDAIVEQSSPYPDCGGCGPYYALQVFTFATAATGPRSFDQVVEGQIQFRFGEATQLTGYLSAIAQRATGQTGAGTAEVLFGDTIYWAGVKELRGPDGRPLANFDLASSSGLDYRRSAMTPVPEPAAAWLLALGLGALLLRVRRQPAA